MIYDLVIPITLKDMPVFLNNYPYILKNIEFDNLYIIGSQKIFESYSSTFNERICFIDENSLYGGLSFQSISKILDEICGNTRRSGWYLQQFLKMSFAFICKNDYYLAWDADTIPLSKLFFYKDGKTLFNLKNEYNKPYFDCIKKILGIEKKNCIKESFISEHMLFSKKYMIEMINVISNNKNLKGNSFFEKIMYSINPKAANRSGFSEFETYGLYMYTFHRDLIEFRSLRTLRNGKYLLGDKVSNTTLDWVAKDFDTISFEKFDKPNKNYLKYNSLKYQKNHSSLDLYDKYYTRLLLRGKIIEIIRKIIR